MKIIPMRLHHILTGGRKVMLYYGGGATIKRAFQQEHGLYMKDFLSFEWSRLHPDGTVTGDYQGGRWEPFSGWARYELQMIEERKALWIFK